MPETVRAEQAIMKKFNSTLEGTDCGDAGLPARNRDSAKARTVLRVVARTPDAKSMALRTAAPSRATPATLRSIPHSP
jgi:hypothetical protein